MKPVESMASICFRRRINRMPDGEELERIWKRHEDPDYYRRERSGTRSSLAEPNGWPVVRKARSARPEY